MDKVGLGSRESIIASHEIDFPEWKHGESYVLYRFDPAYPTCYKCPFCASELKPGVYLPLVFFYKSSRRVIGANSDAAKLNTP